jgi:subtilisin-like proprotein convertase family protein
LGGGSLTQNQTGAIFRARRQDVDMALVELASIPDDAFNVYYAGWDRSGEAPLGAIAIHHPNGDEKAISFSDSLLMKRNSCIFQGDTGSTHWSVPSWNDGTTEPGSSGSGIWHPERKRIIGFLSGGWAACGNNLSDCYGRVDVAWNGSDSASRLRDWLDPNALASATGVDGLDPLKVVGSTVYCNSSSVEIPDGSSTGIASSISVPDDGTLADLDVLLTIDHTYIGDLVVRLRHQQSGVSIRLIDQISCSGDNISIRIDDESGLAIETNCQIGSVAFPEASYRPMQSLSAFDGLLLSGTWELSVSDEVALDEGRLQRWCLDLKVASGGSEAIFQDSFEVLNAE